MKKYTFCFLLFLVTCIGATAAGYLITRTQVRKEEAIPNVTIETETVAEDSVVLNQQEVEPAVSKEPAAKYYLVAEDGFLLVFCQDKSTVCLYTHVPLIDFPVDEQSKLMEGIWFTNMLDIFNYLESYTS